MCLMDLITPILRYSMVIRILYYVHQDPLSDLKSAVLGRFGNEGEATQPKDIYIKRLELLHTSVTYQIAKHDLIVTLNYFHRLSDMDREFFRSPKLTDDILRQWLGVKKKPSRWLERSDMPSFYRKFFGDMKYDAFNAAKRKEKRRKTKKHPQCKWTWTWTPTWVTGTWTWPWSRNYAWIADERRKSSR